MKALLLFATLSLVYFTPVCTAAEDSPNGNQRAAVVEELKRLGAELQFSTHGDTQPGTNHVKAIRIRGDDFVAWDKIAAFPEIEQLDVAGSSIGDGPIRQIATLKNLRELYLDATAVSGSSLAVIGRITTLETLSVANLSIEDKDLGQLQNLKSLKRLNLGGTLVTDVSVAQLRLLNLKWINLGNTKVTSKGARDLQQALATAEVEHDSIERSQPPTPDPNPTLSKEPLPTNKPPEKWARPNPGSANLPQVDHARIKDGTPILAQIVRTGAFVTFRQDDPLKPIQEISLYGRKITDKSLPPVSELDSLDALTVEETRVTDSGFRNIAKLATLKSIRIVRSNVSGGVLVHFSGLTGLETLAIDDLQLTDADLSQLQKLTSLHTLELGATQITDTGLKNIAQWLPKLKVLKLLSNGVTAAGIQDLRNLLPATEIEIHPYDEAAVAAARPQFIAENTPEADEILDRWKKRGASIDTERENPQIVVSFEGGDFSEADLADMKHLLNLSTLTLKDMLITDEGLSHVRSLPRLRALNLSGTRVTDRSLEYLANQKQLDVLVLTGTNVTNEGMKSLGKIASLTSLWLDLTSITDEGLIHLKNLPLERLEMPQITDRGVQHIAHLTKLTRLDLPNVSDDGLKYLKDLKALDILIVGSKVTDAGLKHLLPLCNNLNILSLNGTKITDDGLAGLKDFSRLEYLFLNDTSITDAGLTHLKSMPKLRRVDLQGTAVTEAAVDTYRKSLPPFHTVNR